MVRPRGRSKVQHKLMHKSYRTESSFDGQQTSFTPRKVNPTGLHALMSGGVAQRLAYPCLANEAVMCSNLESSESSLQQQLMPNLSPRGGQGDSLIVLILEWEEKAHRY